MEIFSGGARCKDQHKDGRQDGRKGGDKDGDKLATHKRAIWVIGRCAQNFGIKKRSQNFHL